MGDFCAEPLILSAGAGKHRKCRIDGHEKGLLDIVKKGFGVVGVSSAVTKLRT